MHAFFLYCSLFIVFMMLLALYRAVKGPSVLDRLVGANAIGSKTVLLLIFIGVLFDRVDMFVDIALAYGMLNFLAVLAFSKYFHKRKGLGGGRSES